LGDKSKNIIKDETINNIKVRFQKIIDQHNHDKIKYDYCSNPEFLREGDAI